jgi:CRP-like cAMP-binding protein
MTRRLLHRAVHAAAEPPHNLLLRSLPPADLARLRRLFKPVLLKARREIHIAGAPLDYVYFLEDGLVSVLASTGEGKAVEVWLTGREGLVGMPLIFGGPPSPHRRIVQVNGRALRVRAADLKTAMSEYESLRETLMHYARSVLVQTSQLGACNAAHSLQQRLSRWLLMAHDRCTGDDLPLTHQMLARMLGVRRATVSEAILALEKEGVLAKARSLIQIVDRPRLETLACNCYAVVRSADEHLHTHCHANG